MQVKNLSETGLDVQKILMTFMVNTPGLKNKRLTFAEEEIDAIHGILPSYIDSVRLSNFRIVESIELHALLFHSLTFRRERLFVSSGE